MEKFPKPTGERDLSERQGGQVEHVENKWSYLNQNLRDDAITRITLQTGPTGEGHEYQHAFAARLKNGDIGLVGLSTEFTVKHAIGAGSKEGLQYRDDPERSITENVEPSFMAVVHKDGTIEGDLPREYKDLKKVVSGFGYFYDSGVWGSLKLPPALGVPALKISKSGE